MTTLQQIAATVTAHLPITARATEAWLMLGHNDTRWTLHHRYLLAGSP
jgi:hypothetical protein